MKNKKEIISGIIIIGNEVLSGRTKDINTSTIATWLNTLGIEVKEVRVIPDDKKKIIYRHTLLKQVLDLMKAECISVGSQNEMQFVMKLFEISTNL